MNKAGRIHGTIIKANQSEMKSVTRHMNVILSVFLIEIFDF
jgi:hypothetical protein